jgi:hypothetical protein
MLFAGIVRAQRRVPRITAGDSMFRHFRSPPSTLRRPVLALSIVAAFGLAVSNLAHAQVSVNIGVSSSEPGWFYDRGDVANDAPRSTGRPSNQGAE